MILRSWVVLKNSDIVSADLAAAAVSGGQRLGSSTIPSWYESVCGCSVVGWIPVNCDQFPSIYFFMCIRCFCSPRVRWVVGGVVYTVVPFYNRVRQLEGT